MATVVYQDVDGSEHSFMVGYEPLVIGRAPECSIRCNDPRMSRAHARFYVDQTGNLYIEDLGSANGVFVGPHKVQVSLVPPGEYVLVGSVMFRQLAADGMLPPPSGVNGTLAQWLEVERKARLSAEQERDAYGARMAELHKEVRAMKDAQGQLQVDSRVTGRISELELRSSELHAERSRIHAELAAARERISQLEGLVGNASVQAGSPEARAEALAAEVESFRWRVNDAEEQLRAAEARAKATEEELAVARDDLLATEERLTAELASIEQRGNAEVALRVEELMVARTDLETAEGRIMELSRAMAELEQRLSRSA
jgi:predicted  nucleic acid-binding Zn-ribbon protein